MLEKTKENLWHNVLPIGLILLPGIITSFYINRFAVNVPFWDAWSFVRVLQAYTEGGNWLSIIWEPAQAHRLFFPKLIFLLLAQFTDWNVVTQMYVSHLLAWGSLLILFLLYQKTIGGSLWGFVPVAWLVFSLGQWENILWGWQVSIYLQVFSFLITIFFLTSQRIFWAIIFGIVSSYSFLNGLLIWPIGMLVLIAMRTKKWFLVAWFFSSVLVIGFYFTNYTFGETQFPESVNVLEFVTFFLANIGAPLGGVELMLSTVMGIFVILILLRISWRKWQYGQIFELSELEIISGSLLLFAFISSVVITIGRVGYGHLDWAKSSRYITITSIGIIGIYFLVLNGFQNNSTRVQEHSMLAAFVTVMFVGLITHNLLGIRIGKLKYESRTRMKYALQNYINQPDNALANLTFVDTVKKYAPYLETHNLSSFGETMEVQFLPGVDNRKLYGEILPGQPLIQKYLCPVPELKDIGIHFFTYSRENSSELSITLKEGNRILMQDKIPTQLLQDDKFHYFVLQEPLKECLNHELSLIIESTNGSSGNAVSVWTYPPYYESLSSLSSGNPLSNRVVGLELNSRDLHIFAPGANNWK